MNPMNFGSHSSRLAEYNCPLVVDHCLPEHCRNNVDIRHFGNFWPNFFATSNFNVRYISTSESSNKQARKRPREDGSGADGDGESYGGPMKRCPATPTEMEALHTFCPKCFPSPRDAQSARTMMNRNRKQLEEEGVLPRGYLPPGHTTYRVAMRDLGFKMFHCAMFRGHKDCMLEMHKRGIGGEYDYAGKSYETATTLAVLTHQDPEMLQFLYQLGHGFRDAALNATEFDRPIQEETLPRVIHHFGAKLQPFLLLRLWESSKMHLLCRVFHRDNLRGSRGAVVASTGDWWDRPADALTDLLGELLEPQLPDKERFSRLREFLKTFPDVEIRVEHLTWRTLTALEQRYLLAMGCLKGHLKTVSPEKVGNALVSKLPLVLV